MFRTTLVVVFALMSASGYAPAAVFISTTSFGVTPGLAGFQTVTLTAVSTDLPIQRFDFSGDPSGSVDPATSRGFFGPLNQIVLPGGLSTVFADNNPVILAVIPGANPMQDSQFTFSTNKLLVNPESARESSTSLQAAFSSSTDFGTSIPFAQIVLPVAAGFTYRGVVGTEDGTEFPVSGRISPVSPVITPVTLGEVDQTTTITRNLQSCHCPVVWSGLTSVAGNPAIPATLDSNGRFSWDPTGSKRGPKGNGVLYSWSATVSNPGGTTTALALTLRLIPEPTPATLFALALVSIVAISGRECLSWRTKSNE